MSPRMNSSRKSNKQWMATEKKKNNANVNTNVDANEYETASSSFLTESSASGQGECNLSTAAETSRSSFVPSSPLQTRVLDPSTSPQSSLSTSQSSSPSSSDSSSKQSSLSQTLSSSTLSSSPWSSSISWHSLSSTWSSSTSSSSLLSSTSSSTLSRTSPSTLSSSTSSSTWLSSTPSSSTETHSSTSSRQMRFDPARAMRRPRTARWPVRRSLVSCRRRPRQGRWGRPSWLSRSVAALCSDARALAQLLALALLGSQLSARCAAGATTMTSDVQLRRAFSVSLFEAEMVLHQKMGPAACHPFRRADLLQTCRVAAMATCAPPLERVRTTWENRRVCRCACFVRASRNVARGTRRGSVDGPLPSGLIAEFCASTALSEMCVISQRSTNYTSRGVQGVNDAGGMLIGILSTPHA